MDRQDRGINLVESLNGKFKEFKDLFKSEFAKGLVSSSNEVNKINVQYPQNAAGKFIMLYGFDEFFETIPDNIDSLIVENQSKEDVALDVPRTIGRFKNLKTLLFKNCIKSLPSEIKNCQRLNFLSLSDNKQLQTLPNEVGELPNLAFLALSGNNPALDKNVPQGIRDRFSEEQGGMWFLE
jgi:Leucine-rich repeat (LRR) protein